jgi:hypothetical protein
MSWPLDGRHWPWRRRKVAAETFRGRQTIGFPPSTDLVHSRARRPLPVRGTVFARAVIRSSRAHRRAMHIGISDRAVVYLNGRPLFGGDDTYRSCDYRFSAAWAGTTPSTSPSNGATTTW